MISSSDEAIDESEEEDSLPMVKEEDEDIYFEEQREKTRSSPKTPNEREGIQNCQTPITTVD